MSDKYDDIIAALDNTRAMRCLWRLSLSECRAGRMGSAHLCETWANMGEKKSTELVAMLVKTGRCIAALKAKRKVEPQ